MRLVDVVRHGGVEMTEGLDVIAAHWPTVGLIAAVLFCAYLGTRTLALTVDWVGDALGPLGRFWRARRTISRAEVDDLQRQVAYLKRQVDELRARDECNWEYVLVDQDYHRRLEFLAAERGWRIPAHLSYMEHRDAWLKKHREYEPFAP